LSIKDKVTFSMVASSIQEHRDTNVVVVDKKLKLLKSSVIYGANASGKSNLLEAMQFFRHFVLSSSKETQVTDKIDIESFKLSSETENKPSFFEIIFINGKIKYRYGFIIDKERIHEEWLCYYPKNREVLLFHRKGNNFNIGHSFKEETKDLEKKTRSNALFVSVVAQFNGTISMRVIEWFKKFRIISGLKDDHYSSFTKNKIEDPNFKPSIIEFLKVADLGIENIDLFKIKLKKKDLPKGMPEEIKSEFINRGISNVVTYHKKYSNNSKHVSIEIFDLDMEESEGTKKLFALAGPLIDTLKNGYTLIIDELDTRLHPILTKSIVDIFNSLKNSNNAQLVFATHDISLLNRNNFRRDQVWFTEKSEYGSTSLYSLVEYKKEKGKVRNDASYSKDYILGKYGAIPYIRSNKSLF